MAITKDQAVYRAKVAIPNNKNYEHCSTVELARRNKAKYLLIVTSDSKTATCTTPPCITEQRFLLTDLNLYDEETPNPTSYPLTNEEQAAHLHGQGEKRVVAEYAGIKIVESVTEYPVFSDPITPDHYNADTITTFDVVKAWNLDFFLGNVAKYIQRRGRKGDELEDLKKAQAYLTEKIQQLEAK